MDLPGIPFFASPMAGGVKWKSHFSVKRPREMRWAGEQDVGEHRHRCPGALWIHHLWRVPKVSWMRPWKAPSLSKALSAPVTPPGAHRQ